MGCPVQNVGSNGKAAGLIQKEIYHEFNRLMKDLLFYTKWSKCGHTGTPLEKSLDA